MKVLLVGNSSALIARKKRHPRKTQTKFNLAWMADFKCVIWSSSPINKLRQRNNSKTMIYILPIYISQSIRSFVLFWFLSQKSKFFFGIISKALVSFKQLQFMESLIKSEHVRLLSTQFFQHLTQSKSCSPNHTSSALRNR